MSSQSTPVSILVVDDDAMSRELLSVLLEVEGYEVESAESGDAALAMLADRKVIPQVVLTDIQMPGVSGAALAHGLRKICGPATLLMAMSGSGPSSEAIADFDGFLMKPFSIQEMSSAISSASANVTAAQTGAAPAPDAASNSDMGQSLQQSGTESGTNVNPALDERIYRQLNDAMPGRQLQQMYTMCVNDARDRIASMRESVTTRNDEQFVRQAHAIKGGCGMLGATEIYTIAAQLETSGLDSAGLYGARGVNPLDELIAACDRLERILGSRA